MKCRQSDIIEINFYFPRVGFKPHFAIVVSNDQLQELEGYLYVVLISSKNYNDEYAFELTEEMTSYKFEKRSFVKCHLLELSSDDDIIRRVGVVKKVYFDQIIEKIKTSIF